MTNYDVGYLKPPVAGQFKPGQSGNAKGRPRGSKNTYVILDDILNQKVQMVQDGKTVKIDKRTMALLQNVNKAAKGDIKAFQTLLPHILAIDAKKEERERRLEILSMDEQKILTGFLEDNNGQKNTERSSEE